PRPVILECMTFRMRGHEEASGTKYVPKALMEEWGLKDPVDNYEKFLLAEGIADSAHVEAVKLGIRKEIDQGLATAFAESYPEANTYEEMDDVYAAHSH